METEASKSTTSGSPAGDPLDVISARRKNLAVGGLALVGLVFAIARAPGRRAGESVARAASSVDPVGSTSSGAAEKLSEALAELERIPIGEKPGAKRVLEALSEVGLSTVGRTMPDGKPPPPLPADAPSEVRFSVILVRYRGAQLAPAQSRSREDALARAEAIAARARDDFASALKEGDRGSSDDVGVVRRGILEPAIEYRVFTLPIGWTTGPIDTPRGFWIVRRVR